MWLVDVPEEDYANIPPLRDAIEAVRKKRSESRRMATKKLASTPMLFGEIRQPKTDYLLIPSTSSENREYIPMGFMHADVISNNLNLLIAGANIYHFGVLTSSVHMAWMRTVAGRLKSDYRYSKEVVYNSFPWCKPTKKQKETIEETAQAILTTRKNHPDMTLAEMYGSNMPLDLKEAHMANDLAVLEAYGFNKDLSDLDIFARLMKLYQRIIAQQKNK